MKSIFIQRAYTPIAILILTLGLIFIGYYFTRPIGTNEAVNSALLNTVWIPTALMACLIGALLANSGLLIQAGVDNGFASPATLGIASGALLGAVISKLFFAGSSLAMVWAGAFLGGSILATLVIAVSQYIDGGKLAIILIGMALGLSAGAVASTLILFFEHETDGLFIWGSGQILQTNSDDIKSFAPIGILLCLATNIFLPKLGVIALGDTNASALGLNVKRWRACLLMLSILQASMVTALVGMIGFVGLIAPHIARYVMHAQHQNRHRLHWLLSMLFGAMIVLLAEWASRSLLFIGYRLPTGAMCALVGAPFIIYLLLKNKSQLVASMEKDTMRLKPLINIRNRYILIALSIALIASVLYWLKFDETRVWVNTRVYVALLAGLSLGVAGCLLQNLFRNPMASPDTLGVSTSGILAIACLLMFYPSATAVHINIACLVGALAVIFLLSWGIKNQYSIAHIALFGLAISAFTGTAVQILLTFGSTQTTSTLMWLSGTSYNASNANIIYLICVFVLAMIFIAPLARTLDILPLGNQTPVTLGVPMVKSRMMILLISTGLTTASVSCVGAISFIGLMAPHCARLLGIYKNNALIPASAMIGGVLLVWADGLGRTLIAPNEIPSGLFVSVLGGVYFLGLLFLGYRR